MRLNKLYRSILLLVLLSISFCCTEPFPLVTESFEDVLVVEATITDEYKRQEIKLSRTYLLESETPVFESNANVRIEDSNNNIYNFSETGNGLYLSNSAFQAVPNVAYKLVISTTDGKEYISNSEFLPSKAEMENLYAELVNLNGEIGVQVYVDTNDNLGDANFFRYEYEETYKIVAPYYKNLDAIVIADEFIELVPRDPGEEVCYSSNSSSEIILTSVSGLAENRISKFPVRFISMNSPTLRERYSILVRQYVQSADANTFYKVLKKLNSDGESAFVGNQPGFIQGNIFSSQNVSDKVIGFFDLSSVSSKRIYFDYTEFNLDLPPYFYDCDLRLLDYDKVGSDNPPEQNERAILLYLLSRYNPYKYVSGSSSVYQLASPECGDCTTFSSNLKPSFWED
ncbi:DUF4249 domain-containing protein [Algibacter amylolyticus]|uniref:DUF4249 domain-containing protein n=1 Tax=Algibacter amylolyticus TaxID=1608400 RepID=A0A5M7B8V2_9FLAO|nr:DUF4249 domain-containing protein [Algibacter amylolyticus]KAA5824768.1 DUF4249 domain-containing protein [Algibacter amylolyticus]MBB5268882.1 hypothetical protein [Algibacter amylolyticus]TSJ75933.1 DUF4249 domain-containing protein [Algibacter amylolyticus]